MGRELTRIYTFSNDSFSHLFRKSVNPCIFLAHIIDNSSLEILANGNDMKYQKQFKLPSNAIIEKIKSKFEAKENDHQTLTIRIPKDVKVFQVPISMEE